MLRHKPHPTIGCEADKQSASTSRAATSPGPMFSSRTACSPTSISASCTYGAASAARGTDHSLFLYLKRPDNVGLSLMVDTIALGVLFILALGGTASLSADATFLADCGLSACKTGSGLIGVGWIFTFLVSGSGLRHHHGVGCGSRNTSRPRPQPAPALLRLSPCHISSHEITNTEDPSGPSDSCHLSLIKLTRSSSACCSFKSSGPSSTETAHT